MTFDPAEIWEDGLSREGRSLEDAVLPTLPFGSPDELLDGPVAPWIDWSTFWERDTSEAEWLVEDIIAIRRAHTIWAARKAGKSLLMLWLALQMVRGGTVVVYLDWEMTDDDVHDRLVDMGCGPETDLSLLHYALLPTLAPLNTARGGKALLTLVDDVQAAHPDRHVAVVIDTFSRAVDGDENDNAVPRDFYMHTGIGLKRRRVTYVRLDHAGHEAHHERGASGKGDDVDVSWKLTASDGGLVLDRHLSRMPWVPEKVALTMRGDPLRFEPTAQPWPAGTFECASDLDALRVPLDQSVRDAQKSLKAAGKPRRLSVIALAMKFRRTAMHAPVTSTVTSVSRGPGNTLSENSGKRSGNTPIKPDSHGAETLGKHPETPPPGNRETGSVSVGTHPFPAPADDDEVARWEGMAGVRGSGSVDEPAGAKEPDMAPKRMAIELLEQRYAAEDAAATDPIATSGAK